MGDANGPDRSHAVVVSDAVRLHQTGHSYIVQHFRSVKVDWADFPAVLIAQTKVDPKTMRRHLRSLHTKYTRGSNKGPPFTADFLIPQHRVPKMAMQFNPSRTLS